MILRPCAAVLMMTAALTAAEFGDPDDMRLHDLRLQFGLPPASASVLIARDGQANAEGSVSWDQRSRWSLIYVPRISRATYEGAGLGMIELSTSRYHLGGYSGGGDLSERVTNLDLHLGMGWAVADRVSLEWTFFAGGGASWQEGASLALGPAWEAGSRLGLTMAPATWGGGSPLIGLALLASYGQFRNDVVIDGNAFKLETTVRGFTPALTVGWRF